MEPKIKLKILEEIAHALLYLNMEGIKTQFPINIYFVQPNLNLFKEEIFKTIKKNINNYQEITLFSFLQIFTNREINCPKKLFNLILDKIIEKRKDPTLKKTLDLNYKKKINLKDFKKLNNYKKHILYSEISIDVNYPIFRGLGYNFYTIKNRFYKEYLLPEGKFIYSAEIIKKPKFLITGHTKEQGIFKDYRYFGKLPKEPIFPKLTSKKEKIKYTVDLILKNIGVNKEILKKEIIVLKKPKYIKKNLNSEQQTKLKERIFNSLKERFL
jgi:hypothetical protein